MSLETYGRYQLLKKLATGGMAQIYLARQLGPEGFEKLLVVKRILPHLAENEEFITMFLDEARIAARLNHPNIVQIFDLGAQDDSYFIAMEFIHGEDVRRVWKHADKVGQPIPLALICRIVIEACAGLDYAHKKPDAQGRALNIVHRDISPQNILVSFEGGVKVVDFGIAKAADQATVTKSGVLKGKYSYMSPEQAAGQNIDCRTDIFALGVVLYELLTGTRLFKRGTDIQTLNAVTECNIATPSEVNDRIPRDLDAIVMKALAKDRNERFSEARQLGAALENWLLTNGLPSSAAEVARFMQDIYAERLEREREEGRLLIETADSSRSEDPVPDREKATPSIDGLKRQTKSMRATQSKAAPKREPEVTTAAPGRTGSQSKKVVARALEAAGPQRPVPDVRHPTEASMPTQSSGPSRWPLVAIIGVLVAALAGVGLYSLNGSKAASFEVTSVPPGAAVAKDGVELCTTPCTFSGIEAGPATLTLTLAGYQPEKRSAIFKSGVQEQLPEVRLRPVETHEVKVVQPTVDAQQPMLVIESEPAGAEVFLDGQSVGVTPLSKPLDAGTQVSLRLELAGSVSQSDSFAVAEGPLDVHRYTLKPQTKPVVGKPVIKPPVVTQVDPKPPVVAGKGTVRFVVKPWAQVDCPLARFKDTTPFQDQSFPAGEYACTFTNPEFPAQTRVVRVEPNATTKVQVNFLQ